MLFLLIKEDGMCLWFNGPYFNSQACRMLNWGREKQLLCSIYNFQTYIVQLAVKRNESMLACSSIFGCKIRIAQTSSLPLAPSARDRQTFRERLVLFCILNKSALSQSPAACSCWVHQPSLACRRAGRSEYPQRLPRLRSSLAGHRHERSWRCLARLRCPSHRPRSLLRHHRQTNLR